MSSRLVACLLMAGFSGPSTVLGAEVVADPRGREVVVLYNSRLPESFSVASHYAERRAVPTNQLLGLPLPSGETISRREYRELCEDPLRRWLEAGRMLRGLGTGALAGETPEALARRGSAAEARVRYLVCCFGVPVKILEDPELADRGKETLAAQFRQNHAAVDSELASLPQRSARFLWAGPAPNPAYAATNAAALHPTNGILLVARLDGPSPEVARGLVDKALQAEHRGLWGRAYFDLRGLTNTTYLLGDQWLRGAAEISRRVGYETVVDLSPATWPATFPASDVAFYAGWYDAAVSGPWAASAADFRPGAFGYHLHSFSANVLRTATAHWAGPLLARGVTATVGYTEEPYLHMTLDLPVFWSRWILLGLSYGEAAYAAQQAVSWQATVVGDPLYAPFRRVPGEGPIGLRFQTLHQQLLADGASDIEWSHLQVANLGLQAGMSSGEIRQYLQEQVVSRPSSVLFEKLGELAMAEGKLDAAVRAYGLAAGLPASARARWRQQLALAEIQELVLRPEEALAVYGQLAAAGSEYPDRPAIWQRMLRLARELGRTNEVVRLEEALRGVSSGVSN